MINKKYFGFFLIIISLFFLVTTIIFAIQLDNVVDELMKLSGGICVVDGVCIHEQNNFPIYLGIASGALNLILGVYFIFENKAKSEITSFIEKDQKLKQKEEKFSFLLKGLNEDEKKIIQAVKDQDGISQSTLRIRTDMSKAKLSIVLSALEKKSLIKKVEDGKFNKIYLKTNL
ncbi:MAG: hypothetical protein AABW58_04060 [Nanoarchaeota archaeon]